MKVSFWYHLLQYDTRCYRMMTGGMFLVTALWFVLLALGMPTGLGTGFDIFAILLLHALGSIAVPLLISLLLFYVPLAIPRFTAGYIVYASLVIYGIMNQAVKFDVMASCILTAVCVTAGAAFGLCIALIIDRHRHAGVRLTALIAIVCFVAAAWFGPHHLSASQQSADVPAMGKGLTDSNVATLASLGIGNPGMKGEYAVRSFTYGSGQDKHRPEFGTGTTVVTQTVDASAYIRDWPAWRTVFWGFDPGALPINGRVWMPEGEGVYPLVLIVHGNHTMEKFSDDGYAYLGELLASRGMIAVSVDQNFINYSHWSGIPNDNYKLRTWVLLQHIRELGRLNKQPDNPFYGKIDMQNIALIGHSRGGQAAAMAADAERWFSGDSSLPFPGSYKIQAVVAIAPTDVQVDKQEAVLKDVYYLAIYGGRDADVNTLRGDRQYSRAYYHDPDRFKTALFIEKANHSYFNSSWGPNDIELPMGWFLNHRDTMPREEQEQVAMLYVSAFLEIAFHDRREYTAMFRDYRTAGDWLPGDSRYANRFLSGDFRVLADFERLNSDQEAMYGSTVAAEGFTVWEVGPVKDKNGVSKGTRGAILEWTDEATLTIELSEEYRELVLADQMEDTVLSISYMNASHELSTDEEPAEAPGINVEFVSTDGVSVTVPLSDYADLTPMPETTYTIVPLLEDRLNNGKYRHNVTPVFQTVEIPLAEMESEHESFEAGQLESITFRFDNGPARVVLDDIGFTSRRSDG